MDPRLGRDALGSKIKKLIFSGLLALDETQTPVPDAAARYTVTQATVYDFELREDVVFHDGRRLTSADVKATYESMLDPDLMSSYRGELSVIDRIETPAADRVVFYLRRPYVSFTTLLAVGLLPAADARQYKAGRSLTTENLVGSGPYRPARLQPGSDRLILERFDGYFRGAARTRRLVFRTVQDHTLRALELLKGRLDIVQNAVPYALVPSFREKEHLKFASTVGINFNYIAFNCENPVLKDVRVRRAVAHAIDRRRIMRYKMPGLAAPADSVLNPRHWAYNPGLGGFAFDPETAKALLDAAGYPDPDGDGPGKRFTLVYKTSTDKQRLEIVQLIAEGLSRVGIGVDIRSYEFSTFLRDIKQGDFDIFSLSWVGVTDPDIYYSAFHSASVPPAGHNRGHYANPELDSVIEQARAETDMERRRALLFRVQKIVFDEFPYVPLWYDTNFVLMNSRVEGYAPRADAGFANLVHAYKKP